MADKQNPFTMVYDALWDCMELHPGFSSIVKPGNRIRFDTDTVRGPVKDAVQLGDMPEVMLDTQSVTAKMFYSSSGSQITRQYAWLISTGDYRLQKYLYQVEWQAFCAMHAWQKVLTALKWPLVNGRSFVKRAAIVQANDGQFDGQLNRNIKGWSAVWACEVEMHFAFADLLAELNLPNT